VLELVAVDRSGQEQPRRDQLVAEAHLGGGEPGAGEYPAGFGEDVGLGQAFWAFGAAARGRSQYLPGWASPESSVLTTPAAGPVGTGMKPRPWHQQRPDQNQAIRALSTRCEQAGLSHANRSAILNPKSAASGYLGPHRSSSSRKEVSNAY
jgi:hypothetical protein